MLQGQTKLPELFSLSVSPHIHLFTQTFTFPSDTQTTLAQCERAHTGCEYQQVWSAGPPSSLLTTLTKSTAKDLILASYSKHLTVLSKCCGLHIRVPPKFICWSPSLHCHGIRKWGLWEVIMSWGWSPHDGISSLIRRETRQLAPFLTLPSEDRTRKTVLTRNWIGWPFNPGLSSLRNRFLLFKPPGLWHFCYSSPDWLTHQIKDVTLSRISLKWPLPPYVCDWTCIGLPLTSWVVNSQTPLLLLMLPEFWWAPRKMPSSLWVPLPNFVAPCWTHNLPFIPCLPWSPCQDWTRTSTAPPTSSVSAKSEWLAELEFANYGASGMFWLFKLNSVWNKWKITTMHLSFKPEFPYDYSKWEPIGSHPFYSKHMPFNTLCSLSGSTLVSYWSPTRHFPFFSFLLFKKLLLAQTL